MKTFDFMIRIPARTLALLAAVATVSSAQAASVTLEAEAGTLGSNFTNGNSGGVQFISSTTDLVDSEWPGNANRVATFTVNFPEAGAYDLYARVRVGPAGGGANDDSMFYASSFGVKSTTTAGDWIRMNSLLTGGFTAASDVVSGNGGAGIGVWKWLNLSEYSNGSSETPITFNVTVGNLTQTFQIGARENGFDIDKILFGTANYTFTVAQLDVGAVGTPPSNPPAITTPRDLVAGNLIQFNDNGAWSWYMDERAAVDKVGGKVIVGADLSGAGVGGAPRDGAIDATIFDVASGISQRSVLKPSGLHFGADDHNAPAFLVRPDGKYIAQYAGHNSDFFTYFRIYNGSNWEAETGFDWTTVGAVNGEQTSYSNPYYLAAENRIYSFVRCIENRSPHFLVSTDLGDSWSYGGQLVEPDGVVGYNSGYFRYAGNGVDRIDFICTEAHPRDIQTSMYHGYISNGMTFRTDGTVVDTNLFDQICPVSRNFTLIFSNATVMPVGQTNYRCWNSDVQRYADGSIQAIIHARINQVASGGYPDTVNPNHAFFFCRYNGTNWTSTYLCQAGFKLYSAEADYVGLGALNPDDPNTIYISTRYDPRAVQPGVFDTNQPYSSVREIWKGVTTNHGASFTWTPITRDSVRDNVRPIVPAWNVNNTALLWFRGTYFTAQSYDEAVVGIVERRGEIARQMNFVDATTNNTTLANGSPLVTGEAANQWHERVSSIGGSLLASADATAENAPMLKTLIIAPQTGDYDVWVNFWGNPAADWRIKAGLTTNAMQVFRQMACQQVEPGRHASALVLTNSGTNFLYQVYVGRVTGNTIEVLVDDEPIQTGTANTTIGNTVRTWYEGVSYARVETFRITNVAPSGGNAATITWNSVPRELSLVTPTYTVQKKNNLSDANWTTIATGIPSGGSSTSYVDAAAGDGGYYRVSVP